MDLLAKKLQNAEMIDTLVKKYAESGKIPIQAAVETAKGFLIQTTILERGARPESGLVVIGFP